MVPPQTFKIENPVAVVTTSAHLEKATALKNFLFTPEGQRRSGRLPDSARRPGGDGRIRKGFPAPEKLWTVADLGGWSTVDPALFDKDNGLITKIYKQATG